MTRIAFEPFRDLERFSKFMNDIAHNIERTNHTTANDPVVPRVDVTEDEQALHLFIELAGVSKDDVKVTVGEDNVLTVKGEKKAPEATQTRILRRERRFGTFNRSFTLPENVNTNDIKASFEAGILHLTVAKLQPVKPKEYTVNIN